MERGNTGKSFEALVHSFYLRLVGELQNATIEKSVMVSGPDGMRQIDVRIEHTAATHKFTTYIECKDHTLPLGIGYIDAFSSKIRDLKCSKGVVVSRSGFSKNARQKADRLGIDVVQLDYVSNISSKSITSQPVLFRKLDLLEVQLSNALLREPSIIRISRSFSISGVPATKILIQALKMGKAVERETKPHGRQKHDVCYQINLRDVLSAPYLETETGEKRYLADENAYASLFLKESFLGGFLRDFNDTTIHWNITQEKSLLYVDDGENFDAKVLMLPSFGSLEELPHTWKDCDVLVTYVSQGIVGAEKLQGVIGRDPW